MARSVAGWAYSGALTAALFCGLVERRVLADRIVLRGGGEIKGVELAGDPARPGIVRIQTRTSERPLEFGKAQVLRIDPEDDELRRYVTKLETVGDNAEAQFGLGEWCTAAGLSGPALVHYRRAVELDPDLGEAHKKLGHVYHNGRWMTYDEQRRAQGLVQFKGKWVSPDEKEAMEAKEAFTVEQGSWLRQLRVLRKKLFSGNPQQAQQAEQELAAIREPAAVAPLLTVFGGDGPAVRIRLAQIIAAIPGDDTREALVRLILNEPLLEVRQAALHELDTLRDGETVPRLIRALEHKDPAVVGRSAWALARLNAREAVPKLLPAISKSEKRWVVDPEAAAAGGGGINATFGSVEGMRSVPGGVGGVAVGGATGAVGGGGIYAGGASLPVITGPVVGQGVAAYGATSVPFGNFTGLNTVANPNRPSMRLVTNTYYNEDVLAALRELTGMDFGYDAAAWKRWVTTSFRAEQDNTPGRRVLQP